MGPVSTVEAGPPRNLIELAWYALRNFGLTITLLLGAVIYVLLQDAGIIPSKIRQSVEDHVAMRQQIAQTQLQQGELVKAVTGLAAALSELTKVTKQSGERHDKTVREMWCYAFVKEPTTLKLCKGDPEPAPLR